MPVKLFCGALAKGSKVSIMETGEAFSVLIFNNDGKMLIQKRAKIKYHSGSVSRFSTK